MAEGAHIEPPPSSFATKPSLDAFAVAATELGRGTASVVFRAVQRSSGRVFALKVIDRAGLARLAARHPGAQREVLQEKQAGSRLGGNFVPRLHVTWSDERSLYLLFDLAEGGELWSRLSAPGAGGGPRAPVPLPDAAAAAVTAALCRCIAWAHAQGVVHRDVKPENVVLRGSSPKSAPGQPFPAAAALLLADWGTSKDLLCPVHNAVDTDWGGTPEYMSPESIGSDASAAPVDTAADLWALGAVAYRCLAGCTPFAAPSSYLSMQRASRHTGRSACLCDWIPAGSDSGAVDGLLFPPGLSNAARSLVHALLQREPTARLGVAGRAGGWNGSGTPPGEGGASFPGWAASDDVRTAATGLAGPQAEKEGKRSVRVTSPCLIDHGRILAHPWLHGAAAEGNAVPAMRVDDGAQDLIELADAASAAPLLGLHQLRAAMGSGDTSDGAVRAWRMIWERVQSLPRAALAQLAHLLALRRRLSQPHVWCILWSSFAGARTRRLSLLERRRCGAHAEPVAAWHAAQIGPHGPRTLLAWGCSPDAYVRQDEAASMVPRGLELPGSPVEDTDWRAVDSSAWRGPATFAFLPSPFPCSGAELGRAGDEASRVDLSVCPPALWPWSAQVAAFVCAVNAMPTPPRALLVFGLLNEEGSGSISDAEAAEEGAIYGSPSARVAQGRATVLAEVLAGVEWGETAVVVDPGLAHQACTADSAAERALASLGAAFCATLDGVAIFAADGVAVVAHAGHSAWLAEQVAAAASTTQHSLLLCTRGSSVSEALALGLGGAHALRYAVCAGADGATPLPVAAAEWAEGEGPGWRALRQREVTRLGTGGKPLKCVHFPPLAGLLSEVERWAGGEVTVRVSVPTLRLEQDRAQPGYTFVRVRVGLCAGSSHCTADQCRALGPEVRPASCGVGGSGGQVKST
jgi:hypothetical protein